MHVLTGYRVHQQHQPSARSFVPPSVFSDTPHLSQALGWVHEQTRIGGLDDERKAPSYHCSIKVKYCIPQMINA